MWNSSHGRRSIGDRRRPLAPPGSALHSHCTRNCVRFTLRTRSIGLQHGECGLQRPWRLSKISPGAGKASSARRHASPVTPYGTNATVTPSSATSCQDDDVRGWVHIGCVWRAQGRLLRCIVVEAECLVKLDLGLRTADALISTRTYIHTYMRTRQLPRSLSKKIISSSSIPAASARLVRCTRLRHGQRE